MSFNKVGSKPENGDSKKCTCHCKKIGIAILVLLVLGVVCFHIHHPRSVYSKSETFFDLQPGTMCVVQFRRDTLGELESLVSPMTTSLNGTILNVKGELIAIGHDAILLDQVNEQYIVNDVPEKKRFWIPKSCILSIEYKPTRSFHDLPQDNYLRIQYDAKKYNSTEETP